MALYSTERKFLDSQRSVGIAASAKNGNYKGRSRIRVDKLISEEIFSNYESKKMEIDIDKEPSNINFGNCLITNISRLTKSFEARQADSVSNFFLL